MALLNHLTPFFIKETSVSDKGQYYKIKIGCGKHRQDGVNYKSGDLIPSVVDLAKIFPNKFIKAREVPTDEKADSTLNKPNLNNIVTDESVEFEITEVTNNVFIDRIKNTKDITVKQAPLKEAQITKDNPGSIYTIKSELGTNVTKDFPIAVDLEIIILSSGDLYIPADVDLPNYALHKAMTEVELLNWLNDQV